MPPSDRFWEGGEGMFDVPFHFAAESTPFVVVDTTIDGRRVPALLDTGDAAPYVVVIGPRARWKTKATLTGATLTSRAVIGSTPVVFRSVTVRRVSLGGIPVGRPAVGGA